VRGWRGALSGAGAALAVLLALVAVLGPALAAIPLNWLQTGIGVLLLLFGLRWLRKASLRAAGVIPLHDEAAAFEEETRKLRGQSLAKGFDVVGASAAFQITMLEGVEVVFIVIAIGAGRPGLLLPACFGALAALAVVVLLGLVVHRPLARVPENSLKFVVGTLLSAFGVFWFGEGVGVGWPGDDWAILALIAGFGLIALVTSRLSRPAAARAAA
jgi:uncharacterized membrane protein